MAKYGAKTVGNTILSFFDSEKPNLLRCTAWTYLLQSWDRPAFCIVELNVSNCWHSRSQPSGTDGSRCSTVRTWSPNPSTTNNSRHFVRITITVNDPSNVILRTQQYLSKGVNISVISTEYRRFTVSRLGHKLDIWTSLSSQGLLLIMGTHTTRFLYTQSFRRCFDKREASSNLIPYFLSLESSLADKDVFCTLLEPFHVRRPEPAAWIYLHVYNRRRTFLYAFARGKNS